LFGSQATFSLLVFFRGMSSFSLVKLLIFSNSNLSCCSTLASLPFSFRPCLAPLSTQKYFYTFVQNFCPYKVNFNVLLMRGKPSTNTKKFLIRNVYNLNRLKLQIFFFFTIFNYITFRYQRCTLKKS
jgi:hypothetical protein